MRVTRASDRHIALLDDLVGRIDEVALRSAEAIRGSIPAYARAWDMIGSGVQEVVCVTDLRLLETWRTGEQPTQDDFARLGRIGVPPPELGINLEDILHAYRISGAVIIGAFKEASEAHPGIEPGWLLNATLFGFYYLNDLSIAVTREGVKREQTRLQRREEGERALIGALVARPPRLDEAGRLARMLGLPTLAGPWLVIVSKPEPSTEHPSDSFAKVVRGLRDALDERGCDECVLSVIDGHVVAVARPPGDAETVGDVPGAVLGIGSEHQGPAGVQESFDEARIALDVAGMNRRSYAHFDRIWLDRLLIGSISPEELADRILMPLREIPDGKRRELELTLDTFLEVDRNVTEAARRLHVHPHTVRYRLAQLEKRLGGILDTHDQRLALQIALRARRNAGH